LFQPDLTPLPAFTAFKLCVKIGACDLLAAGDAVGVPKVWIFEFTNGIRRIWVAWAIDGATYNLSLPQEPSAVYDTLGAPLQVSNTVPVDWSPVYIEFAQ